MLPKARCDIALMEAVLVEAFFKEILCKDACLWETVHSFLYFDVDCTSLGPIYLHPKRNLFFAETGSW